MLFSVMSSLVSWIFYLLWLVTSAATQCANQEPEFFEAEYATLDFATIGSGKQLSLCRVNNNFQGCTIEWFKDGKPLKTPSRSHFSSNRQYLFISKVEASDRGNYSCNVTNKAGEISRSLHLETYESRNEQPFNCQWTGCKLDNTPLGGNVSASCLFRVSAPDLTVCNWKKKNGTAELVHLFNFDDINYSTSTCEGYPNGNTCGNSESFNFSDPRLFACLNLYNVTEEYYGEYILSVGNIDVPLKLNKSIEEPPVRIFEATVIYIAFGSILLVCLTSILIWHFFKTDVKLYFKDNWGGKTENDGKLYDAYVSYVWNDIDTQFALSLKQHLEMRGYKVFVPEVELAPGGCTVEEINEALEKSRRFIMILSNQYIDGSMAAFEVTSFVDQVSHYKKNIISVVFKDSKIDAENFRAILKHVLRVSRVVKWAGFCGIAPDVDTIERSYKTKVFKELLLGMPRKPKVKNGGNNIAMQAHTNSGFSSNI